MSAYTTLGIVFSNTATPAEALAASAAYQEGRLSTNSQNAAPTLPPNATATEMRMILQNFANGQSDQRVENAVIQAQTAVIQAQNLIPDQPA